MNQAVRPRIAASACPHDCPSTCALEVEIFDGTHHRPRARRRGQRLHGRRDLRQGRALCRARASSRPADTAAAPHRRRKAAAQFAPISWDDALDLVAEQFIRAEQRTARRRCGPIYYAGTMGYVMRDGIHRLRHAKKYSGFFSTICVNPAWTGFIAGTGKLAGPDPREMAKSDLVVIWGTNAVNTQVNVMTHATRARKERGAKIVVVDVYMNATMRAGRPAGADPARHRRRARLRGDALPVPRRQSRLGLSRPLHRCAARAGRACAKPRSRLGVAHHRLPGRDDRGLRPPGRRATSAPTSASATASPARATAPINMHAASCIAAVTGAWRYEGGGAFHNNGGIFHLEQQPDRRHRRARSRRSACSTSRASARS